MVEGSLRPGRLQNRGEFWDERIFRTKESFEVARGGGYSRLNSKSCGFLRENSWYLGHVPSSVIRANF